MNLYLTEEPIKKRHRFVESVQPSQTVEDNNDATVSRSKSDADKTINRPKKAFKIRTTNY